MPKALNRKVREENQPSLSAVFSEEFFASFAVQAF
jgi:hypothetical protein